VDIVVRGCAVQASKPRPLKTVSDGDLGVPVVVELLELSAVLLGVLLAAAKVRASASPEGAVTSALEWA
jgi:hypothetical protein